jgi:hypothetical protein
LAPLGRHGIEHYETQHKDTQHNDTQHNDTQHKELKTDTRHKRHSITILCHYGTFHLLLC